jgi:hypothetical protein
MFIPDRGCAYSTNAAVTALPIAADFAFHWSEAMSRYELPQLVSTEDFGLEEIVIRLQSMLKEFEAGPQHSQHYAFLRPALATAAGLRGAVVFNGFNFFAVFNADFRFGSELNSEGTSRLAVFHSRSRS